MNIYKLKPTYSRDTGELEGQMVFPDKILCDYTGNEINKDDCDFKPTYKISFIYNNDSEEDWFYDDVEKIIKLLSSFPNEKDFNFDHNIRAVLALDKFHYSIINGDYVDASVLLAKDWIEGINIKDNMFFNCHSFAEAARIQRRKLVLGFLENKTYSPLELGLVGIE